ncbi:methyl-accepting chemotaxis sensory transducer [Paracidovorax avenae ATCC 19860]|uniref:Methyl-accepting chemotaxis sensory transducer n=1 Tax=Paracidovorax avenae (strain ATCC 19860 / DSM 7227 / CCUG 15838 / JCM 20985 / LMG 2117 / NCPPB 1011) TaxID=643561 RepID=F0Q4Q6_PARA1|nr:methyl-accepting chemotaxis protein [Paracidovorax avenae]ADX45560.1 methyl-accepting chemotaxis sensory transducer [Paracidovorax avenae ATCC 19860]
MNLQHLRIGLKLAIAFALTTALTLAMGLAAWMQMHTIQAGAEDLASNWLPSVQAIGNARTAANRVRRTESELFLPEPTEATAKRREELAHRMAQFAEAEQVYAPLVTPGEEQRLFGEYRAARDAYAKVQARLLALPPDARAEATRMFFGESEQAFDAMAGALGTLADFNRKSADIAEQNVRTVYGRAVWTLAGLVAAAVAIAVALAWWITGLITRPIREAVVIAQGVASGDLTMPIVPRGRDEAAQLMEALAGMRDGLSQVVGGVRANAESVATASAEIEQGNIDLSSRTEEQASALEQTAASMEELGSTVRQNSDNARQASALAQDAASAAARSGEAVGTMVGTMRSIDEASRRIADIIGLIDGIAFQTNILALNAAVEAARAGEQGRGFAVVAGEVRSLAQRSAAAAKDIKELIATSTHRVQDGSQQAEQAGSAVQAAMELIQKVASIVSEISIATREQSDGVAQVGEAVTQMDQATQQNAALVEESAAAASSLKAQADQLVGAVSVFRLPA